MESYNSSELLKERMTIIEDKNTELIKIIKSKRVKQVLIIIGAVSAGYLSGKYLP